MFSVYRGKEGDNTIPAMVLATKQTRTASLMQRFDDNLAEVIRFGIVSAGSFGASAIYTANAFGFGQSNTSKGYLIAAAAAASGLGVICVHYLRKNIKERKGLKEELMALERKEQDQ